MQIVNNHDRAEMLAKRFQPIIYQEWKSIKDFPTSLMFDDEKTMESNLAWAISDPTLYYRVSEDDDHIYAFYMVFHPFDWSSSKIGFIRKLDSHTYDTESFCVRWSKLYGELDIATVYHYSIKKQFCVKWPIVRIESEGHAIMPYDPEHESINTNNYAVYTKNNVKLCNIDTIPVAQWYQIKKIVNGKGVDMPDQQAEHGDMFNHPDKLFKRRN